MWVFRLWWGIQVAGLHALLFLACVASFLLLMDKVAESFESGHLGEILDTVLFSLAESFAQVWKFVRGGRRH